MKHKKIWLGIFISIVFLIMAACGNVETPATPTLTATPTLEIGSSQVSPKDGMVMVYVPAGEFVMGSTEADIDKVMAQCSGCKREWFVVEQPQHTVTLDAFWIDKTEVTNAMFGKFVEAMQYETDAEEKGVGSFVLNKSSGSLEITTGADWQHPWGPSSDLTGKEKHPVVQVSWNDAVAYCQWAGGRLPTEAEWEKAARGTDGRTYPWGEGIDCSLANYRGKDNGNAACKRGTTEVGSYPEGASVYGALDMAGNVVEWVADWYQVYPGGDANASSDFGQTYRVGRGGSDLDESRDVRASNRNWDDPDLWNVNYGFRCVG